MVAITDCKPVPERQEKTTHDPPPQGHEFLNPQSLHLVCRALGHSEAVVVIPSKYRSVELNPKTRVRVARAYTL